MSNLKITAGDLIEVKCKVFSGRMKKYNGAKGSVIQRCGNENEREVLVEFVNGTYRNLDAQIMKIEDLVVIPRREIYGEND